MEDGSGKGGSEEGGRGKVVKILPRGVEILKPLRWTALLISMALLTACNTNPSGANTSSSITAGHPAAGSSTASSGSSSGGPVPKGLWTSDLHTNTVTDFPVPPLSSHSIKVTTQIRDPESLAFDANGNLWVGEGGTSSGPPAMIEFRGNALVQNAAPMTKIILNAGLSPEGLAFDANGNLWVAAGSGIVEYRGTSLASHPSPVRVLSSARLDGPDSLAFDTAGNLWVANYNNRTIVEYGLHTLQSSHVTYRHDIPLPSGAAPFALAFDTHGNLWVACQNNRIYEYAGSTLGETTTPTASINMSSHISGGAVGLAFDAQGNLWASGVGQSAAGAPEGVVYEYAAASLGRMDTPSAVLVASANSNPGTWALAAFPLPGGTGLH